MTQSRTHKLEERKREERFGELRSMAYRKRGLTCWRGGRGRSSLVSFETRHDTNEDSPTGGEEEGGVGLRDVKRGKTEISNRRGEGGKRGEGVGEVCGMGNQEEVVGRCREGRTRRGGVIG